MASDSVSVNIPVGLYHLLRRLAEATHQSVDAVVQSSLASALPPLDDVPEAEAMALAALSAMDDTALWQVVRQELTPADQAEMHRLLDLQGEGPLAGSDDGRLQALINLYHGMTVRRAHAMLLLARRGYQVPVENGS